MAFPKTELACSTDCEKVAVGMEAVGQARTGWGKARQLGRVCALADSCSNGPVQTEAGIVCGIDMAELQQAVEQPRSRQEIADDMAAMAFTRAVM